MKKVVTSSKFRKNQNTIEKNEFYEWKIWRTIMKTMNENSFICIKINNWFQYDRASPAFFLSSSISTAEFSNRIFVSIFFYHRSHTGQILTADFFEIKRSLRQHSSLSSTHTGQFFQQLVLSNQMKAPLAPLFATGLYRPIFSTAGFFSIKRNLRQHPFLSSIHAGQFFQQLISSDQIKAPSALLSIIDLYRPIFSTADFFSIKWGLRQHPFLPPAHTDQILIFFSWNNPPKTTLYKNFWWFSYRKIFSPIFLHGLNFEFYFNLSYQWNE